MSFNILYTHLSRCATYTQLITYYQSITSVRLTRCNCTETAKGIDIMCHKLNVLIFILSISLVSGFTDSTDASWSLTPPLGYYYLGKTLSRCTPGHYCVNGQKISCPDRTYGILFIKR